MRVSKEKAAQNRQDILTAAARLFREQGVSATGVDAITKDASLTHLQGIGVRSCNPTYCNYQ